MSRFVAAFITDYHGRVLLVRHRERAWELPGGRIEPNEKPIRAAIRECEEETGVSPWLDLHPREIGDCAVYSGKPRDGLATLAPRDPVIVEARWCSREKVRTLPLSDVPSAVVLREWAVPERPPAAIESAYYDLLATAVQEAYGLPATATVGEMVSAIIGRAQSADAVAGEILDAVAGPGERTVVGIAHGAEVREIVARAVGAVPATLTREEARARLLANGVTGSDADEALNGPRETIAEYDPRDIAAEHRDRAQRTLAILRAYVAGLDAHGAGLTAVMKDAREEVLKWPAWKRSDDVKRDFPNLYPRPDDLDAAAKRAREEYLSVLERDWQRPMGDNERATWRRVVLAAREGMAPPTATLPEDGHLTQGEWSEIQAIVGDCGPLAGTPPMLRRLVAAWRGARAEIASLRAELDALRARPALTEDVRAAAEEALQLASDAWTLAQTQDGEVLPDGTGHCGDYYDTSEIIVTPSEEHPEGVHVADCADVATAERIIRARTLLPLLARAVLGMGKHADTPIIAADVSAAMQRMASEHLNEIDRVRAERDEIYQELLNVREKRTAAVQKQEEARAESASLRTELDVLREKARAVCDDASVPDYQGSESLLEVYSGLVDSLRTELDKPSGASLTAERDAWKALAIARGGLLGLSEPENDDAETATASAAEVEAEQALRALGIDPEAPPSATPPARPLVAGVDADEARANARAIVEHEQAVSWIERWQIDGDLTDRVRAVSQIAREVCETIGCAPEDAPGRVRELTTPRGVARKALAVGSPTPEPMTEERADQIARGIAPRWAAGPDVLAEAITDALLAAARGDYGAPAPTPESAEEVDPEDLWDDWRAERDRVTSGDRAAFLAGVDAGRRTRAKGDATPSPERTPETVLRAMLADYEAAALEAHIANYQAEDGTGAREQERCETLELQVGELRAETGHLSATSAEEPDLTSPSLIADYEARLSGARPLHAPPLASETTKGEDR